MKVCDQCDKIFVNVMMLNEHKHKVHVRVKIEEDRGMETFFQCRVCDVKFQRYEDLEKHCSVHAAENSQQLSPLDSMWKSMPVNEPAKTNCINFSVLERNSSEHFPAHASKPSPPQQPWKNVDHSTVCTCTCAKVKRLKTIPSYKHQKLQEKYRKLFAENKLLRRKLAAAEREPENKNGKACLCRSGRKRKLQENGGCHHSVSDSNLEEGTPSAAKIFQTESPSCSLRKSSANRKNISIDSENSCCFYCGELCTAIKKHYFEKHADTPTVLKILTLKEKGKVKNVQHQLTLLRYRGNNKHNRNVAKANKGTLLVACKVDVKSRSIGDFTACPRCKGWYLKTNVNSHINKTCIVTSVTLPRLPKVKFPTPYVRDSAGFQKILSEMKDDEIKKVVKEDELILSIGEYFYTKDGLVGLCADVASKQMRAAAFFLLKVREISKSLTDLESCFKLDLAKTVGEAIKIIVLQNSSRENVNFRRYIDNYLKEWVAVKMVESYEDPSKVSESEQFISRVKSLVVNSPSYMSDVDEEEEEGKDDDDGAWNEKEEEEEEEEGDKNDDDDEIEENNAEASNNEEKKKLRYRKLSVCLFCGKHIYSKIMRHYKAKHMLEPAMQEACSKTGKDHHMAMRMIKSKGNFKHNVSVIRENRSDIIVAVRPHNGVVVASEFLPCPYCYGFFSRVLLLKHMRTCYFRPETESPVRGQNKARLMLASALSLPKGVEEAHKFLSTLRSKRDILGQAMMKDKLLISFGKMLVDELGHLKIDDICQRMRHLAQFTITLNEHQIRRIDLHEIVSGRHFISVISAVKKMACFSEGKKTAEICGKPDVALKMGHNLSKLAFFKCGLAIKEGDSNAARDAEIFSRFIANSWHKQIGSVALNSFKTVKLGKRDLIPLTTDLMTLRDFLTERITNLSVALREAPNLDDWNKLCEAVMCSLALVNWHRGSGHDAEMLTVASYRERPQWVADQLQSDFTQLEKHICSRMDVVKLPQQQYTEEYWLLIPPLVKSSIEVLLSTREACDIPESNSYIFANKFDSHFDVIATLRSFAEQLELSNIEEMLKKDLKRFISTLFQVTDLNSSEVQWLFNYLAEHVQILENFLTLPQNVTDMAKVCKLFLATESGLIEKYRGQSFQDLHLNEIGLIRCDDSTEDDEENGSETVSKETDHTTTSRDSEEKHNGTVENNENTNKMADKTVGNDENTNKMADKEAGKEEEEEGSIDTDTDLEEINVIQKMKKKKLDKYRMLDARTTDRKQRWPTEEDGNWSDEADFRKVGTIKREKWTTKENTLFWNSFQKDIEAKRIPSGKTIAEKGRNFPGRTVAQIRTRIHNFISGKQKLQM